MSIRVSGCRGVSFLSVIRARYHHNKRIEIGNDTVRVLLIFSINIVLTGLVIVTGLG